jgi:hypothetical protein
VDDFRHRRLGRARLLACTRPGAQGRGFFGYFLFSIVFFPLALIVAYLVSDRSAGA